MSDICGGFKEYFEYHNRYRVHQSLKMDAPAGRRNQTIEEGDVVAVPRVGGLHHHYERRVAWCLKTKADQFSGRTVIAHGHIELSFPVPRISGGASALTVVAPALTQLIAFNLPVTWI
ncbi:MAG TPA: hypothetical protein EYN96_04990 [Candidatus Hydrogenedentes bacterium]|nr:hypothetical protein [Candidatus Hydrogenedentota bacterium]